MGMLVPLLGPIGSMGPWQQGVHRRECWKISAILSSISSLRRIRFIVRLNEDIRETASPHKNIGKINKEKNRGAKQCNGKPKHHQRFDFLVVVRRAKNKVRADTESYNDWRKRHRPPKNFNGKL